MILLLFLISSRIILILQSLIFYISKKTINIVLLYYYFLNIHYRFRIYINNLRGSKQFNIFEKKCDIGYNINVGINSKMQCITNLLRIITFSANNITIFKYRREYLTYISKNDCFKKRFQILIDRPSVDHDSRNISAPRLLYMIDEHDARVYCGIPHPQTDHQIQQQALAKEQQQKLQEDKKKHKEFNKPKNFKDFKKPPHEPFS